MRGGGGGGLLIVADQSCESLLFYSFRRLFKIVKEQLVLYYTSLLLSTCLLFEEAEM